MSKEKKKIKRLEKEAVQKSVSAKPPVKMVFGENKFYHDMYNPLYLAGKVYDIESHMVDRWLRRGGIIVDEVSNHKAENKEPIEPVQEKLEDGLKSEQDDI